MCTETFQNLSQSKKDRIIHAALTEFSTHPFNEASITNIVKNAKIFLEEVFINILTIRKSISILSADLYNKHREDLVHILNDNERFISSLMEFYDHYIDEIVNSKYFDFYKNTFTYVNHHLIGQNGILSLSDQPTFRKKQQEQFLKVINIKNLKAENNMEVLEYIYFIVNTIHHMILDGFVNDLSLEGIKKRSFRAVEWLYYGIQKEK